MADVRELVTRILFKLDKNSVRNAEKATDNIKKNMGKVGDAGVIAARRTDTALSNMARSAEAANGALKGTLRSLRDAIRGVGTEAAASGKKIKDMAANVTGQQAAKAGATLAAGGAVAAATGAGMLYPLKSMVDVYKEAEFYIKKTQAVTEATNEAMESLERAVQATASETKFTVAEISKAAYDMAVLGMNSKEIEASLNTIARSASAAGTSFGTMQHVIITGMNSQKLKITQDNIKEFADTLLAAQSSSAVSIESLGAAMEYAGAAGKLFGANTKDLAMSIGLMGNIAVDGTRAGTALRAIFSRLPSNIKQVKAALQTLGVEVSTDGKGIKDYDKLLDEMRAKWQNLSQVEKLAVAKGIAGIEGSTAFSAMMDAPKEKFNPLRKAIYSDSAGKVDRMYEVMRQTAEDASIRANSAIDVTTGKLGKQLIPVFIKLCDWVSRAANAISDFVDKHPKLTKAILLFAGAVGSLLVLLGTLALTAGGVVMALGSIATALGVGSIGALVAALGPVALAIAAIIAALALLYVYWDDVKAAANACIGAINKKLDEWRGKLREVWQAFQSYIEPIKAILDGILNVIQMIVTGVGNMQVAFAGSIRRAESRAMQQYRTYNNTANQNISFTVKDNHEAAGIVNDIYPSFDDMP